MVSISGSRRDAQLPLFHALILREMRPLRVHARPFVGNFSVGDGQGWPTRGAGVVVNAPDGAASVPPFVVRYSKVARAGRMVASADEEGYVTLVDTSGSLPLAGERHADDQWDPQASWLAHNNAIFDLAWTQGDAGMLTAAGDQTVKLWDVERQEDTRTFRGHTGSVKTLALRPHSHNVVFASGSRDGTIHFWDERSADNGEGGACCKPVATLEDAHAGHSLSSTRKPKSAQKRTTPSKSKVGITSVVYLDDENYLASACTADSVLKFWDMRKTDSPALLVTLPSADQAGAKRLHGISDLALDPRKGRLAASCSDHSISLLDTLRPEAGPLRHFTGHVSQSFYLKIAFSPDGSHLVSGSSDKMVYIWQVERPELGPWALPGHQGEVSGVDWCPSDFTSLVTCGDDSTMRIWNIDRREPPLLPMYQAAVSANETDSAGCVAGTPYEDVSKMSESPQWQPTSCSGTHFTLRVRYVDGLDNCEHLDDSEVDENALQGMVKKLFVNEEHQLTPGRAAPSPITPPGSQLRVQKDSAQERELHVHRPSDDCISPSTIDTQTSQHNPTHARDNGANQSQSSTSSASAPSVNLKRTIHLRGSNKKRRTYVPETPCEGQRTIKHFYTLTPVVVQPVVSPPSTPIP